MTMHTQPTAHFDPGMSLYAATHSSYWLSCSSYPSCHC
jgi:hypothetical protein